MPLTNTGMITRKSLLGYGVTTLYAIFVFILSSCDGGTLTPTTPAPPPVLDECFTGTYWDGDIFLDVTHEAGQISATGSPPPGSTWEILNFTGSVSERGVARGDATVWLFHDGERKEVTLPLELSLNEGTTCAERNTLTYSFRFYVTWLNRSVSGDFRGTREVD